MKAIVSMARASFSMIILLVMKEASSGRVFMGREPIPKCGVTNMLGNGKMIKKMAEEH